ncbi:carbonic anhydrase [Xylariaceae sp. AK1471]|nr:carbonic anhydrase [Xylariaceae sp. AK1471]
MSFSSSSTSHVLELIGKSEEYVKMHTPPPLIADTPVSARPHTIIFCCADGRINPLALFDLKLTDAIVVRNAGCGMPRMISDLIFLDQFTGLKEILIISHTDCGLTHVTDHSVRQGIKKNITGHDEEIDGLYVGAFQDYSDRVKSDAAFVRAHPLVRKELADNVFGAVYDIQTGKLTQVEV